MIPRRQNAESARRDEAIIGRGVERHRRERGGGLVAIRTICDDRGVRHGSDQGIAQGSTTNGLSAEGCMLPMSRMRWRNDLCLRIHARL